MRMELRWDEKKLNEIYPLIEANLFQRQENASLHNTFVFAEDQFTAVLNGDEQMLREAIASGVDLGGEPGVLSEDTLRNFKDLCICYLVLLGNRTIQEHALDVEIACAISDSGIQMIEHAGTSDDVVQALVNAEFAFCRYVRKRNENYHPLAKGAKDYIYKHLHETIRIRDIAEKLDTTPSYLAQVFKKSEGITLHQFIMQEKLERSKNLLQYSDYDIQAISQYLGFHSQSHFTREFTRLVGVSPARYRSRFNQNYRENL